MPNIKSAKKRVLTNKRKEDENILVESRMKNSIKKLEKTIKEGNVEESNTELTTTLKNIDKAQNINIIKKNKASRLKSRLTKSVNNLK
ncbi:MAG: 30S ribosomal protein S20 [Bacilli bacterium]|nr:30S ribosomal protein S20 [Bacilli bacterium]